MRFLVRLLITGSVIVLCTWVAEKHRLPSLAGLIAVMPLTGLFVLIWLYHDQPHNFSLMAAYTKGALWGILPSILFFLTAFICFTKRLPLWIALIVSFWAWLIAAIVHQWLLGR